MILTISLLQVGLKLLMDSSEEHFLVAMLISLSKLASIFSFLISEQVFPIFYVELVCIL